jgi:transcriptional regulator with XRE-family HTH domain
MPIRELEHDPRSPEQKRADQEVLEAVERGEFPTPDAAARKEALARLRKKKQARAQAAELGAALGAARRELGITQERLAEALGTQKSNISRLESGRYGGMSIETFLAACTALKNLSGTDPLPSLLEALQEPAAPLKRSKRRRTVYLSAELEQRLDRYCAARGGEPDQAIEEALAGFLSAQEGRNP